MILWFLLVNVLFVYFLFFGLGLYGTEQLTEFIEFPIENILRFHGNPCKYQLLGASV